MDDPITPQQEKSFYKSSRQIQWSADAALLMLAWSQDHPILRIPLLWLQKLLLAYSRWHYCRMNRIYAKVTAND